MKYYKVLPEHDNKMQLNKRGKYAGFYIANELYTPCEVVKMNLNRAFMVPVDISKRKIYWFFGARFAVHNEEV